MRYEFDPVPLEQAPNGLPGPKESPVMGLLHDFLSSGHAAARIRANGEDSLKLRNRLSAYALRRKLPIRVALDRGAIYLIRKDGDQ